MDGKRSNDMTGLIAAYGQAESAIDGAYIVPLAWTPAHVAHRLVEAFDALGRHVAAPGPARLKAAWPSILREAADLVGDVPRERVLKQAARAGKRAPEGKEWDAHVDDRTKRLMQLDAAEQAIGKRDRPSADEIDRADEALNWASRYLADEPLQADALQLWAWAQAHNRNVAAILRARVLKADDLLWRRAGGTAGRAQRSDVMPGKILSRIGLDYYRKKAAERVALSLKRDRVGVR